MEYARIFQEVIIAHVMKAISTIVHQIKYALVGNVLFIKQHHSLFIFKMLILSLESVCQTWVKLFSMLYNEYKIVFYGVTGKLAPCLYLVFCLSGFFKNLFPIFCYRHVLIHIQDKKTMKILL